MSLKGNRQYCYLLDECDMDKNSTIAGEIPVVGSM